MSFTTALLISAGILLLTHLVWQVIVNFYMIKRCRDSVLLVISSERWMAFEELKQRVNVSDVFLDVALKGLEREGLIESRALPNVDTNKKHRTHNKAFRRKKQRRPTPS